MAPRVDRTALSLVPSSAFSGLSWGCVDCLTPATRLIGYWRYKVGDIVCSVHLVIRLEQLGALISHVGRLPRPHDIEVEQV